MPTKPPPARRITKAEKTLRVTRVKELLIKGMTRREIIGYVAAKTDWKAADRTVDDYIAAAYEEFKLASEIVDKDQERRIAAERFQLLYEMAVKLQDVKSATTAEWKRCELLGLPAPKEQTITINHNIQSKLDSIIQKAGSEERAAEILAALEQELPDYVQ